jgi:hypothetical protein
MPDYSYYAVFRLDGELHCTGRFYTTGAADEYAATLGPDIEYLGAGRETGYTAMRRLEAATSLTAMLAELPRHPSRRVGRVTRWEEREDYALITDQACETWFLSRADYPIPLDPAIRLGPDVEFLGSKTKRPDKRYQDIQVINPLNKRKRT